MTRNAKADPLTDSRKAQGEYLRIWAEQWNPALEPVAQFITAVESGTPPSPQSLAHIAAALRELFCHRDTDMSLAAVGVKLKLKRKQGKRALTFQESLPTILDAEEIFTVEGALIEQGMKPAEAQAQAIREVAKRRRVSVRTAQSWRKKYLWMRDRAISEARTLRNENPG